MHGGHQAALDAPLVVEHLGDRRQAVGRARGVGDDGLAGVGLVVDAVDEHRRVVLRRGRHDDLLRARVDVLLRGFLGEEQARRFDDDVGADGTPVQFGRVLHGGQADATAVDDQGVAVYADLALEAAVHGVVLEHIGQIVGLQQVVDADHLDILEILRRGAEHHAADAAESVDTYLDGHVRSLQFKTLLTAAATLSAVRPKNLNASLAGALSPNRSMPTTAPPWSAAPTYLRQ
jgi:hypothetical protein